LMDIPGHIQIIPVSRDLSNRADENPSKLELSGLNRWCLNDEQQ